MGENNFDKWASVINSMGVTGSKVDWLSQYAQLHHEAEANTSSQVLNSATFSGSLFPMAVNMAAKTVAFDLVSVTPMPGPSNGDNERIAKEVLKENRDRKIDALIENKDFEEMTMKDHPDYRGPAGSLLYIDYVYGTSSLKK